MIIVINFCDVYGTILRVLYDKPFLIRYRSTTLDFGFEDMDLQQKFWESAFAPVTFFRCICILFNEYYSFFFSFRIFSSFIFLHDNSLAGKIKPNGKILRYILLLFS